MNLVKSAVSVLVASCVLVGSVPARAYEETTVVSEMYAKSSKTNSLKDFEYEYIKDIKGYRITGYKGKSKKVVVPSKIKGKPVKQLGEYAFEDSNMQSVVIPEGVTEIGFGCFISCSSLKRVKLPKTLKTIQPYAFEFCSSLTDINIPSSVETISSCAFKDCSSLKKANIPSGVKTIEIATFSGCTSLESVTISQGLKEIEFNAFKDCGKLKSLSLPASLEKFDVSSLEGCGSVGLISVSPGNPNFVLDNGVIFSADRTKLYYCPRTSEGSYTVPDSVTTISDSAFADCAKLKNIVIGSGVKYIEACVFSRCTSLESIVLPGNVFSVGTEAFSGCTSLKSVTAHEGVTYWSDSCFRDCVSLSDFTFPDSTYQLGIDLFQGCKSLTSINVPPIARPSSRTFSGCPSLRAINVDSANKDYSSRDGVLYDKSGEELLRFPQGKGTSYSIPNGVKKIGGFAFSSCSDLKSVTIPSSVTSIATSSFEGCTSLKSLSVPSSVKEITYPTFYGLDIKVKYKGKTYTKDNMNDIYT